MGCKQLLLGTAVGTCLAVLGWYSMQKAWEKKGRPDDRDRKDRANQGSENGPCNNNNGYSVTDDSKVATPSLEHRQLPKPGMSQMVSNILSELLKILHPNGQELQRLQQRLSGLVNLSSRDPVSLVQVFQAVVDQLSDPDSFERFVVELRSSLISVSPEVEELLSRLSAGLSVFRFDQDILVLYTEEDRPDAVAFKIHLQEQFADLNIRVLLYDEFNAGNSVMQSLENVFNLFRFVCIYVSDHLTVDRYTRYIDEICLTETLKEETKKARLIPVWSQKQWSRVKELNPLPGFKYYHFLKNNKDCVYISCVRREIIDGRNSIQNVRV